MLVRTRACPALTTLGLALMASAFIAPSALAGDRVAVSSNGSISVQGDVGKNRITVDRAGDVYTITDPDANFTDLEVHRGQCSGGQTHKVTCSNGPAGRVSILIFGDSSDDELTLLTP